MQEIIRSAQAGLVSDAEDIEGLVDNIKRLCEMDKNEREQFGKNVLKYSSEHFNKKLLLDRMDKILQGGIH